MEEGQKVFIRTVTHYYTGKVLEVSDKWIKLADAAWVADTGRFAGALESGELNEVEVYPEGVPVYVAIGAIVDLCPWKHELPRKTK
jgi:hypothetical protein